MAPIATTAAGLTIRNPNPNVKPVVALAVKPTMWGPTEPVLAMGQPKGYALTVMERDNRLLCMGLLSKVPMRSKVLQHFLDEKDLRWYSDAEKRQMLGLYWLPGLHKPWIRHQFATYAPHRNPDHLMRFLRRIAYNPEYREKWQYVGEQNVQYILQPEVERFFLRRPPGKAHIPFWALPVLNEHRKQGWTLQKIADHYNLGLPTVFKVLKRSMFDTDGRLANLVSYPKGKDKT